MKLRKAGPMVHFMVYDPAGAEWSMGTSMIKVLSSILLQPLLPEFY